MSVKAITSPVAGRLGANLGLLATTAAWGTMIPVLNLLLPRWDAFFLAAARYGLALPFLLAALKLREPGRLLPAGVAPWRVLVLGAIGIGAFAPLFTFGVAHANPITAAILSASGPVIALFVAWLVDRAPVDRRLVPGIALVVIGGTIATVDFRAGGRLFDLRGGEPLMLLGSFCWTWSSLTAQRWLAGCSQLRIATLLLLPGVAVLFLVDLAAIPVGLAHWPPAMRGAFDGALFLWMGLVSVLAGLLLWNHGVRVLGVVVASFFLNLIPIAAVLITALLGTLPTGWQLAGGALVLGGVMQAQRHRPAGPRHQATASGRRGAS